MNNSLINNNTNVKVCQECWKRKPGQKGNTKCGTCGGQYWKVNFSKNHPDYQQRKTRLKQNSKVLFHQTAPNFADLIIKSKQMKRGSTGMAGGGIYFACSPQETEGKAHQKGVILKCLVKLGNIKTVHVNGDTSITFQALLTQGYDSVLIPRPGGTEYVVYNYDQVIVISDNRGNKVGCEFGDNCTRNSSKHIAIFHKDKVKKSNPSSGNLVCKYGKLCYDSSLEHQKKWHSYEKKKGECKYGTKCYKTNQEHIKKYHTHDSVIPCKFGEKCTDQTPEHRKKFDHPSATQKRACWFGANCTDKSPEHQKNFEHQKTSDHTSSSIKKPCRYAANCTDKSPEHRNKFSHFTSSNSQDSDNEVEKPCRYGSKCHDQTAEHRKRFSHPMSSPFSAPPSPMTHSYPTTYSSNSAPSTPSFKAKKPCRYGEKCYDQKPEHRQKYDHNQ